MSDAPCGYCRHPLPDRDVLRACPNCGSVVLGIVFNADTTLGDVARAMLRGHEAGVEDCRMRDLCLMVLTPAGEPPSCALVTLDHDPESLSFGKVSSRGLVRIWPPLEPK